MAKQPLNARGRRYAQMKAQACSRAEILLEMFGLDLNDPTVDRKAVHAADMQCQRWRDHPGFDDAFESEINRILRAAAAPALQVLMDQIKSEGTEPYLRNKAANDVMQHRRTALKAEEDSVVTIKVEGMPELGTPDD